MVDLEKSSEQFWNIPREVGQILYFLVRGKRPKRILEIGTSSGYSGIWLAKALSDNAAEFGAMGELVTVESHAERFVLAGQNFEKTQLNGFIKQVKGHAPEVFETEELIKSGRFDLMFLDATKKQHEEFLKQGLPLLSEGGMLVADNVLSHAEVMSGFLKFAEDSEDLSGGEVLAVGDGLFIAIKKGRNGPSV